MDSTPPHPFPPPNTSLHNSYSNMLTGTPNSGNNSSSMIYQFNSMGPNNNAAALGVGLPNPNSYEGSTISVANSLQFDGSSSNMRPCEFHIDPAKKKRGRPRKYVPDNNIELGLSATPNSTASATSAALVCHGDSVGNDGGGISGSEPSSKRQRGRPPGSGKKQMDALGTGGVGFTPHVIEVNAGEDITSKLVAFSQQGPREICILNACGAVTDVTLRQPLMSGDRTVVYEGPHEIISLSGSFLLSENSGNHRNGGLSVSMGGPDGRVLGGGVSGKLTAASPVQIIVGSFIAEGKKLMSTMQLGPSSSPAPYATSFGATATTSTVSPQSQGQSSDSSDDNGGNNNNNQLNRGPMLYNNTSQPMHSNMGIYNMWTGQAQQ